MVAEESEECISVEEKCTEKLHENIPDFVAIVRSLKQAAKNSMASCSAGGAE